MGIIKTAKRLIFLAAFIYLLISAWPYIDNYFPNSREKITGLTTEKIITPVVDVVSEKASSLKNDLFENKKIVISLSNSNSTK